MLINGLAVKTQKILAMSSVIGILRPWHRKLSVKGLCHPYSLVACTVSRSLAALSYEKTLLAQLPGKTWRTENLI